MQQGALNKVIDVASETIYLFIILHCSTEVRPPLASLGVLRDPRVAPAHCVQLLSQLLHLLLQTLQVQGVRLAAEK